MLASLVRLGEPDLQRQQAPRTRSPRDAALVKRAIDGDRRRAEGVTADCRRGRPGRGASSSARSTSGKRGSTAASRPERRSSTRPDDTDGASPAAREGFDDTSFTCAELAARRRAVGRLAPAGADRVAVRTQARIGDGAGQASAIVRPSERSLTHVRGRRHRRPAADERPRPRARRLDDSRRADRGAAPAGRGSRAQVSTRSPIFTCRPAAIPTAADANQVGVGVIAVSRAGCSAPSAACSPDGTAASSRSQPSRYSIDQNGYRAHRHAPRRGAPARGRSRSASSRPARTATSTTSPGSPSRTARTQSATGRSSNCGSEASPAARPRCSLTAARATTVAASRWPSARRTARRTCRPARAVIRTLETTETCTNKARMRAMLLGASNLWFPVRRSALTLPRSAAISKLANALLHHQHWATLRTLTEPGALEPLVGTPLLADFAESTATELRAAIGEAVRRDRKRREGTAPRRPAPRGMASARARRAASGRTTSRRSSEPTPTRYGELIERVVLVPRLREVAALIGFTRVEAPFDDEARRPPASNLTRTPPTWVPVSVVRGEGIFIQLPRGRRGGVGDCESGSRRLVPRGTPDMASGARQDRSRRGLPRHPLRPRCTPRPRADAPARACLRVLAGRDPRADLQRRPAGTGRLRRWRACC